MAIIVANRISISANTPDGFSQLKEILQKWLETSNSDEGFFEKICPLNEERPEDVWGCYSDIGLDDYEVDVEVFGINEDDWDKGIVTFTGSNVEFTLDFDTAYNSAYKIIDYMHNNFDHLTIFGSGQSEDGAFWFEYYDGKFHDVEFFDVWFEGNHEYFRFEKGEVEFVGTFGARYTGGKEITPFTLSIKGSGLADLDSIADLFVCEIYQYVLDKHNVSAFDIGLFGENKFELLPHIQWMIDQSSKTSYKSLFSSRDPLKSAAPNRNSATCC